MKSLKNFATFSIPLIAVLFSFSIYIIIDKIVENYKNKIISDYSIIVVANTPLNKKNIETLGSIDVKKIVTLKKKSIIDNFKNRLSSNSLELLRVRLPYFYKIYLDEFPTTSNLKQIRKELKSIKNIKRVETFSKNHSTIYSLILLSQKIITILFIVMLLFSILLLSKQIKIWFFEHKLRIKIMKLHGASTLSSFGPIIKVAFFSSLFSSLFVMIVIIGFLGNITHFFSSELIDIIHIEFDIKFDFIKILTLSIFISSLAVFGVLTKYKAKAGSKE